MIPFHDLRNSKCAIIIFLNVCEVANGATAGSKKVTVVSGMVIRSTQYGNKSPSFNVKGSKPAVYVDVDLGAATGTA